MGYWGWGPIFIMGSMGSTMMGSPFSIELLEWTRMGSLFFWDFE